MQVKCLFLFQAEVRCYWVSGIGYWVLVFTDLIIYYENSSFFLDIIGCSEAFSENRFQVSGVRFQAGSHLFYY
jgi:hypothetical protein